MWTFKKRLMYIFYLVFAYWLPSSRRCKAAKKLRVFFARRVLASCGKNVNVERFAWFNPEVSLGDDSTIGVRCELYGPVHIGNNVMMAAETLCYTRNHRHDRIDVPMDHQGYEEYKPITIGNDVWIGRRAMIMPGVHIGNGVIIGAGGGSSLKTSPIIASPAGCPRAL